MINKFIVTIFLITLQLCLAGCSKDHAAAAVQAAATNSGGGGSTGNTGNTSKMYNALGAHPTLGPYESFTLNPDGTAEYFLYFMGTGWTKAVGTYSIDHTTNDMTLSLTYTEASTALTSVCGISFVQTFPYVEVDANTLEMPNYGMPSNGNYVIDSVSGLTVPDVSSMGDICP